MLNWKNEFKPILITLLLIATVLMLMGCSSSTTLVKTEAAPISAELRTECLTGLPLLQGGSDADILKNRQDTYAQYTDCRKRHKRLNEAIPVSDNTLPVTTNEDLVALVERNKGNGWADLPPPRKAFGMRYLIDYDRRKAASEAGFSPDKGIRLLREPLLSAYIADLQSQNLVTNLVTEDFIRTQFLNLIPLLSGQEEIPIVLGDGDQIFAKKFHAGELTNVLKELAKSTKFYEDGSGNNASVNVNINLADLLGNIEDSGIIIDA